jgi:hypothetical protein
MDGLLLFKELLAENFIGLKADLTPDMASKSRGRK